MLSGSNDSKLTSQQVDPKVVPLYHVWQELVHVQTLDVYQYRVLTSFSALKELLSGSLQRKAKGISRGGRTLYRRHFLDISTVKGQTRGNTKLFLPLCNQFVPQR